MDGLDYSGYSSTGMGLITVVIYHMDGLDYSGDSSTWMGLSTLVVHPHGWA